MTEYEQIIEVYEKYFHEDAKIMIDVGANIGRTSNAIIKRYPNIEVHAIEPHPEIFEMLRNEHPSFNCHQLALSDFNGSSMFHSVSIKKDGIPGDSSLLNRSDYNVSNSRIVDVEVLTGKYFLKINNLLNTLIDIVKIDVEGNAMQVVEGFAECLKNIKLIHIELEKNEIWDGQKSADEVMEKLNSNGFDLTNIIYNDVQIDAVFINMEYINE